jgi:hypothetical protein
MTKSAEFKVIFTALYYYLNTILKLNNLPIMKKMIQYNLEISNRVVIVNEKTKGSAPELKAICINLESEIKEQEQEDDKIIKKDMEPKVKIALKLHTIDMDDINVDIGLKNSLKKHYGESVMQGIWVYLKDTETIKYAFQVDREDRKKIIEWQEKLLDWKKLSDFMRKNKYYFEVSENTYKTSDKLKIFIDKYKPVINATDDARFIIKFE